MRVCVSVGRATHLFLALLGVALLASMVFSQTESDATEVDQQTSVAPAAEAPAPESVEPAADTLPPEDEATVDSLEETPDESSEAQSMELLAGEESYTPVSFQAIQPQTAVKPDGYYETGLFTGAATYGYGLPVMPGTNGLAPSFSLSYSSQNALERGWVGNGWSLGDNFVSRDVNGTLTDWSDDEYQLHLNGARYDLVYVASEGLFHTNPESYLYVEMKAGAPNEGGRYWVVMGKDGVKYRFGYTGNSELWRNTTGKPITKSYSTTLYKNTVGCDNTHVFNAGTAGWITQSSVSTTSCQPYEDAVCSSAIIPIDPARATEQICLSSHYGESDCDSPGHCSTAADYSFQYNTPDNRTYPVSVRWSLDVVEDTHGNKIYYNYTENPGSSDKGSVYLARVDYNNDLRRSIQFVLENDTNPRMRYIGGAKVVAAERLKEIQEKYDGILVRKILFNYSQNDLKTVTYLKSVQICGSDGTTCLPKTEFGYSLPEPGWNYTTDFALPCRFVYGCTLANLNGDALPDLVLANQTHKKAWLNNGTGFVQNNSWLPSESVRMDGDSGFGVLDLNGDGYDDIQGPDYGYLNTGSGWSITYGWNPACDFRSTTECRFVDLNNDGYVDAMTTAGDTHHAWINTGSGFVQDDSWAPDIGVGFGIDPDWGVIDLNGDGNVDILGSQKIMNTGLDLAWLGYSSDWNTTCTFKGGDKCRYVDLDSDGLVDIMKVDGYGHAWLNNGSGWVANDNWGAGVLNSDDKTNIADMNGDGLVDINGSLKKGEAPHALKWVKNSLGGNLSIKYRRALGFNTTIGGNLNYPLWLVDSVTADNKMSGAHSSNSSTAYYYEGGLHDYQDKEFRGFSKVVQTRTDGGRTISLFHQDDGRKGQIYEESAEDSRGNKYTVSKNNISSSQTNGVYLSKLLGITNYLYDGGVDPKTSKVEYDYDSLGNVIATKYLGDTAVSGDEKFSYAEYVYNQSALKPPIPGSPSGQWWTLADTAYSAPTYYRSDWGEDNIYLGQGFCSFDDGCSCSDNCDYMFGDAVYSNGGWIVKYLDLRKYQKAMMNFTAALHRDNGNPYLEVFMDENLTANISSSQTWNNNTAQWFGSYDLTAYAGGIHRLKFVLHSGGCNNACWSRVEALVVKGSECIDDTNCLCDENYRCVRSNITYIADKAKRTLLLSADNATKVSETFLVYDNLGYDVPPVKGDLTSKFDWLSSANVNITSSMGYDSYGNSVNTTDPLGRVTRQVYGLNDTTYTYPEKTINVLGHTVYVSYDFGSGNVLYSVDANGYVVQHRYDVLGRKLKDILPYDSESSPTASYSYSLDGVPPEAVKAVKNTGNGNLSVLEYSDGLGRLVQAKRDAEDPTKQIVTDVYYNPLGQVDRQSIPYLADKSDTYSSPSLVLYTRLQYDVVGRTANVTNTDGSAKKQEFDRYTITAYDENGKRKDYILDAHGRVAYVKEYNGAEVYTTSYGYDALDNLINITDNQGNIFRFYYDSLGRKTSMDDPDLGVWTYGYDLAGNLVNQTDNRVQTTSFEYDTLNRVVEKTYPDESVTYEYDRLNGTLSEVSGQIQAVSYDYDQRLRKTRETVVLDGISSVTEWTYDSADRVSRQTLPDGTMLNYTYNAQGELETIQNIISDIDYDALNKITYKDYGVVNTTLTYDTSSFRLKRIYSAGLQDFEYGYDASGNVMNITDNVLGKSQHFTYDDLNRLATALESGGYNQAYSYDSIGNILWVRLDNCQDTYGYNSSSIPHAVKSVSNACYIGGIMGSQPPAGGDWVISQNTSCVGCFVHVVDGNIVYDPLWELDVENGTIRVDYGVNMTYNNTLTLSGSEMVLDWGGQ
ncbi:MAG: toxin TcdB middle/N-terminal domain-containing protein [Candidatus Altiarchaeota archaeon]